MKRDPFVHQQLAALGRRTASGGGVTELTGDVTAGPGAGSQSATIANDARHERQAREHGGSHHQGRAAAAGAGDPTDLTADQVSTILDGATDPFIRSSAPGSPFGGGGTPGALVLLEQHTASSSASLDFTSNLIAARTSRRARSASMGSRSRKRMTDSHSGAIGHG